MASLYCFVQFEFTHAVGPHAGRYVVANPMAVDEHGAVLRTRAVPRDQELAGATMTAGTADVLAITVSEAKSVRLRLRRRARPADAADRADDVPLLLATFIRATEPMSEAEAARMLATVTASEDAQEGIVMDGLRVLNRAIQAYRVGARDPYITEVSRRDARRVRIGYGASEEVSEGRWQQAVVLPAAIGHKPSRVERLAPSEITAQVLSGRGTVLQGEDVLLRAYTDLDHGRERAAALQVSAAIHLLGVEFSELAATDLTGLNLEALAATADGLVSRTSAIGGDDGAVAELEELIASLERGIERWRYADAEVQRGR